MSLAPAVPPTPDLAEKPWQPTRLSRLSALMCCVAALGGAVGEIALAWIWLSPDWVRTVVAPRVGVLPEQVALSTQVQLAGFLVSMLPLGVLLYALHQAYGLFDTYRRGNVFAKDAPLRLRRIGFSMMALAVLRPIASALLSMVLTYQNPPGGRLLVISFSLDDYMLAALAGLFFAIGHVMVEAARLADDAAQIV